MYKKDNNLIECSLVIDEFENKKPNDDFLLNLWRYVLFGYNDTRKMPECFYCGSIRYSGYTGEFTYSGLGGVKSVGMGKMFIISEDCKTIYNIPNVNFHYFFTHGRTPNEKFKNAVLYGPKPGTEKYGKIVSKYFEKILENEKKRFPNGTGICKKCGKMSWFSLAYSKDTDEINSCTNKVSVYKQKVIEEEQYNDKKKKWSRFFSKKYKYDIEKKIDVVEICLLCFKYNEISY